MTYSLGTKSRANLARIHPDLRRVVERAITITTQDFCVYDGARSAAEQNALYRSGASQKDGFKSKSNHQATPDGWGHAVDLVPWVDGKPVWDDTWERHYAVALAMARAAFDLAIQIRWGGNWYEPMNIYTPSLAAMKAAVERYKRDHPGPDFIDAPHFELWRP